MYAIFHPDLDIQAWHVYIAYLIITWSCCALVIFGNRFLPMLNNIGLFLITIGGLVTIIVVAAMPKKHASTSFVWTEWDNQTGWSSGVAFLTGVLNGAFTIGTPDGVTHMAEELPNPKKDMPKAVAAQMILGTLSMSCVEILGPRADLTNSFLSIRHHDYVRHHRPRRRNRLKWVLPNCCRLCSSDWK
jgi:choline transport protein